MINNKKVYMKILLLIIILLITLSTQTLAVSVAKITGLTIKSISETQVTISWNKLTDVTGYQIYIKEGNGEYNYIGSISKTLVSIINLEAGETYSVKVRAYKTTNGNTSYGSFSTAITFTTKSTNNENTTVNKVTNFKLVNVAETTAKFTWDKVSNATGYEVYIKRTNSTYKSLGKVTSTNLTIAGLTEGTTYYVRIRAYRTVNGTTTYDSEYSNEVKFTTKVSNTDENLTLEKVTNIKLVKTTETTAKLTWDKVSNATGYEVYLRKVNGSYEKIGNTTNANVTITGLTEGTTYYVRIRAYRTVNGTIKYAPMYSNEMKFVTDSKKEEITELNRVTNLKSKNIMKSTTDLMWSRILNADGYEIYLRTAETGYSLNSTTSNTYTTLKDLTPNTTYYAKVRAYKVENRTKIYGEFSTEISFTTAKESVQQTPDETIYKVSNLKVDSTTTQAKLTWNAISNIDGYEIYVKNKGKEYQSLGKTSKNNATLIGLSAGKTYNIKVRAYKIIDGTTIYGEFSNEVTFTTPQEETLGTVTNLQVTLSSKQAKLTWDTVSTAIGYEVYIKLPGQGYKSLGTVINRDNVRIVNLATGSNYSVKVRAYKVVNGTTIYGEFSNEVTFTAE